MPPPTSSDERTIRIIHDLIREAGCEPDSFRGLLLTQQIETTLKMIADELDTGQLKLITNALKEMRYAYTVFNQYRGIRKIAIYGSARTPEDHPDYLAAKSFSRAIAGEGWMAITGAGDGIMKAGHEGPQRKGSFGLSIRLPFETTANEVIEGDPKLINFRYFFTRKLMFMSHADAVAVFPGGFGTQDELFETLTLVQTGKTNVIPIVLLEGEDGVYWEHWARNIRKNFVENGWIGEGDPDLYTIAHSTEGALQHVLKFYAVYHSSRYVGDQLVMRLHRSLTENQLEQLNDEFSSLVKEGCIKSCPALEGETDHLDLPRIRFTHHRRNYSMLRRLIDRINEFAPMRTNSVKAT